MYQRNIHKCIHFLKEIHNPSLVSPVFFGKKKNSQKPRREVRFDETLVVWQRRCFPFIYSSISFLFILFIYSYTCVYIWIYMYIHIFLYLFIFWLFFFNIIYFWSFPFFFEYFFSYNFFIFIFIHRFIFIAVNLPFSTTYWVPPPPMHHRSISTQQSK